MRWTVEADDAGQLATVCPHCGSRGTIVEQDSAIRWNSLTFEDGDPNSATAVMGDEGDWSFERWYCTAPGCGRSDLEEPAGFEIRDWT